MAKKRRKVTVREMVGELMDVGVTAVSSGCGCVCRGEAANVAGYPH